MIAFCEEYVKDYNASGAAARAGYSALVSNVTAAKLMKDPRIQDRIETLKKERFERNRMQIDEVISILTDIARTKITDLLDESGHLKPLDEIPEHAKHAIEELSVRKHFVGGEFAGLTHRIKATGKQAALDKIIKILGGYQADNEQKRPDPIVLSFNPFEDTGGPLQIESK